MYFLPVQLASLPSSYVIDLPLPAAVQWLCAGTALLLCAPLLAVLVRRDAGSGLIPLRRPQLRSGAGLRARNAELSGDRRGAPPKSGGGVPAAPATSSSGATDAHSAFAMRDLEAKLAASEAQVKALKQRVRRLQSESGTESSVTSSPSLRSRLLDAAAAPGVLQDGSEDSGTPEGD